MLRLFFRIRKWVKISIICPRHEKLWCWDLRLVAPRDGWPNPAAVAMASGGSDLLDTATVYPSTLDAAGDISLLVATTARRRGIAQTEMNPRQAASAIIAHHQAGGKAALLFGGERAGLDNDEVALANIIVTVPLNPSFSSLNLAQAVLLMGWECRMTALPVWMVTCSMNNQRLVR